jgi:DNA-binding PucR family transcriptional regulator
MAAPDTAARRHPTGAASPPEVAPELLAALRADGTEPGRLIELAESYQQERDRWIRSATAVRVETVRELLDGRPVDVDVASQRLGHELRGRHLAMLVSAEPTTDALPDHSTLERAAAAAAAAVGCADPLLVPAGTSVLWAWATPADLTDEDVVARLEEHVTGDGLRLAIGRPGAGPDGFRVSHEEARHAAELRADIGAHGSRTASYRSLELLSLLTADPERGRRFARRELGALASDDDASARLRETVLAFLEHSGSHTAAAQALCLHKNTVYTRIRRAERVLGSPVTPGRVSLHAAVALAVAMPDRVIGDQDDEN